MLIGGTFVGGECDYAFGKTLIRSPFDGHAVGTAAEGGDDEALAAVDVASEAFKTWSLSPRHERQSILRRIAALIRERRSELVDLLVDEIAKPITLARGEVDRMAITFDLAADLLATWGLESLPADLDPRGEGYTIRTERFPLGVIAGIVPYNWPYNLAAHKIAPALATGNCMVLKVSPLAPLSTLELARIVHEAGAPAGVLNAINVPPASMQRAIDREEVKMLSFTGSPAVGWSLKERYASKRITLELGGDASAIVCADADLEWAAKRCAIGAFGFAGQICISIQHLLVHDSVYDRFKELLLAEIAELSVRDPHDERAICGPLIHSEAAAKVEAMIDEALATGAKRLCGGPAESAYLPPTLLEDVPASLALACEEAFGPVATLSRYSNEDEAFARVNRSAYGIHAGVFTHDLRVAERAFRSLEVGGVVVNDYPTLRFDAAPYGGVKRSGFGREGLRYAMDEMTELRTLVVRTR